MGSCTDLATKPEVAQKLDKADEPRIIKASAAVAVPSVVAILATYADEAAAIAKQALGLAKSALGQIAKLLGGLANILSIIGLLATQAQLLILNNDVRNLQKQLKQVQSIATGAAFRAEEAIRASNAATALANAATSKANEAVNTANGIAGKANQAITVANAASAEATRARSEAIDARRAADDAARAANYASTEANAALTRANTAIATGNDAKGVANSASSAANAASAKADRAIAEANSNAQELASLKAEVSQLKQELRSKDIGLAVLKAAIAATQQEVTTKESKGVVRTVKEATITNAAGIRDLNGRLIGIDSRIGKTVSELGTTLTQTFDGKIAKQTSDIKAGIGTGSISLEGAKAGVFSELFGNTKTNSKLKEVINTEVTTQTKTLEQVNTQQYTDLKNQVGALPGVLGGLLVGSVVTGLKPIGAAVNQTVTQTAPAAISQAAAAGVCSTTAPGGCMNNNILQPINRNLDRYINAAGAAASAANNALLVRMQGVLNTVKSTTDVIKGTTAATFSTVNNAKYGLQAMQNFASTAWKATHADKIMNAIITMAVLHNAAMLSQNVGQTLADAANSGLSLLGVKDSQGGAIDVGQAIGSTIKAKITEIIGASGYNALSETWLKLNRIHQAVGATVSAIQGTKNALLEADEITGGNVAKIGNALQDQGVIEDDTYRWMDDTPDYQGNFKGILGKLEQVEEVAERVSAIVGAGLEIKESSTELVNSSEELEKATKDFVDDYQEKKDDATTTSQSPTVDRLDLLKKEDE